MQKDEYAKKCVERVNFLSCIKPIFFFDYYQMRMCEKEKKILGQYSPNCFAPCMVPLLIFPVAVVLETFPCSTSSNCHRLKQM